MHVELDFPDTVRFEALVRVINYLRDFVHVVLARNREGFPSNVVDRVHVRWCLNGGFYLF